MTTEASALKVRTTDDMKTAMRAQNKAWLSSIRLLLAAIKQKEVDERKVLTDGEIIDVIVKMIKQRKDSVTQYEAAGRTDLADIEKREMADLEAYLPEALSPEALSALIDEAMAACEASSLKDMGKVMAWLREKVQGRVDMGALGALIKQRLS